MVKSYELLLRQSLENWSEQCGSSSVDDVVELTLLNAIDECIIALCANHKARLLTASPVKGKQIKKMELFVTPQNFNISPIDFVNIARYEIELPLTRKLRFIGKTLDSVVSHRYCYVSNALTLNFQTQTP